MIKQMDTLEALMACNNINKVIPSKHLKESYKKKLAESLQLKESFLSDVKSSMNKYFPNVKVTVQQYYDFLNPAYSVIIDDIGNTKKRDDIYKMLKSKIKNKYKETDLDTYENKIEVSLQDYDKVEEKIFGDKLSSLRRDDKDYRTKVYNILDKAIDDGIIDDVGFSVLQDKYLHKKKNESLKIKENASLRTKTSNNQPKSKSIKEEYNVREYTDMLFDMVEEGAIDAKQLAQDLMYWVSEDDIKRYMEVNDLLYNDEEEDYFEESLKKKSSCRKCNKKK